MNFFNFKSKVFGWVDHPTSQTNTFFFTSSLCKTLMRFFFVSIVKRRHLLLPIFTPQNKLRKEKENNRKRKSKIQEDTHEESLEYCPSR